MLSGVGVICFVASYALALGLEATRPLFRSGIRGAAMLFAAAAGFVAHTAFLYYHAMAPGGNPMTSQQGWFYLAAWILVAAYLYLTLYHRKTWFGLYLLPVVLGLIGAGHLWGDKRPFEEGRPVWAVIHGLTLLLMMVATAIGAVGGLMYLLQAGKLKRKIRASKGLQLPSLEWLQRLCERATAVTTLLLGLGILSGIVLNRIEFGRSPDQAVPWHDPIVFGSLILMVCLLAWQALARVYRPLREGHRLAYQSLLCFVLLLGIVLGSIAGQTRHWRGTATHEHREDQVADPARPDQAESRGEEARP